MRFTQLILTLMLWIQNQIVSFASQTTVTTTTEATDLEDGHPNHQLWKKMIDPARSSSSDQ
jgi:hypothetical protein